MTIEQFRKAQQARPFRPYTLCLTSGKRIRVASPKFVAVSPGGRTIAVATEDDAFDVVDLLLVEAIEVGKSKRK